MMKRFNFAAKITESVQEKEDGDLFIEGVAINETVTRNGITYTAVELEKSAPSLVGRPILKDHEAKVDNIVGRVTESGFDTNKINFKARIPDKDMKEKIRNGLVNEVSIGAGAEIIDKETKESGKQRIATNIQFYELSFVAIPGDPGAGVTMMNALAESFDSKKEIKEDRKMAEENKDVSEELKQKLEEREKEIAKLMLEKKEALVNSILEINSSLKKEVLMEKSDSELQIMKEYEKKISESKKTEVPVVKEKSETKAEVGKMEEKTEKKTLIITATEMYIVPNKDGTFPALEVN